MLILYGHFVTYWLCESYVGLLNNENEITYTSDEGDERFISFAIIVFHQGG